MSTWLDLWIQVFLFVAVHQEKNLWPVWKRICSMPKESKRYLFYFVVSSWFDPPMFISHGCTARPPNGHLRSRHTSGRNCLTPYGNRGYLFVKVGNILSHRSLILVLLASWCGLRWLMEQPDGSYMPQLPRFQWLYGVVKAWGVETIPFLVAQPFSNIWG